MADPDPVSRWRSGNQKLPRETFNTFKYNSINIHRVFVESLPCWRLGAWLRPVSRGNRHFKRYAAVERQSGPRPEIRFLRQPALEGLTNSARTETPQCSDRNKSDHVDGGTRRWHGATQGGGRSTACGRGRGGRV
ncbi:serine carboxypeptidase-like 11 [Dorcoceras hygrometricum]|uniref:Serine carboxypeptidase-like 11 n=1 Tax=Dorcoceras hygrometricum TaxID=472368 RepID=A0A2Z7CST7_9LAMI|nr:serine carboxypeptidase-like 11 [Dorcoceras hygrometricum]